MDDEIERHEFEKMKEKALITVPATWPLSGLPFGSPWWTQRRWR
jgi:hypothetical protein